MGNRISFSYRDAIRIEGENTRFNGVYNNFISAEDHGVNILNGAKENHIGGPGAENHIQARDFGVVLQGAGTENNIVQGIDSTRMAFRAWRCLGARATT